MKQTRVRGWWTPRATCPAVGLSLTQWFSLSLVLLPFMSLDGWVGTGVSYQIFFVKGKSHSFA